MIKSGIDQDALIKMFSEASDKQGEMLRKAVSEATLKALQGRELSLNNIKSVLKTVTEAASAGAAKNIAPPVDVEAMLERIACAMAAGAIFPHLSFHSVIFRGIAGEGGEKLIAGQLPNPILLVFDRLQDEIAARLFFQFGAGVAALVG